MGYYASLSASDAATSSGYMFIRMYVLGTVAILFSISHAPPPGGAAG